MAAPPAGRRAALWRSTPVRQALGLVAVVAAVNLASLALAWVTLRNDLMSTLAQDLAQEVAGFDVSATPAALAAFVDARARVTDPARTIYVFVGDDGRTAGNAEARFEGARFPGARTERPREEGAKLVLTPRPGGAPLGEAGYLHEIRRLSGGVLIVAESLAPVEDLRDTFLALLILSLAPTVLISLGAGALIARRAVRRVDEIEAVLNRFASGDLTARVAASGPAGDDLARIGSGVNRMAAKQEAATTALRQVSADIAHDLRTPLQRISVLLGDLTARLPPEAPEAALAEQAAAEAERAVAVFQALLQIAQIEGGSPRDRFAPVDLTALARQFAELYEPAAEAADKALTVTLPEGPALVTGDRNLIGQALANLIENALRHGGTGRRIGIGVTPSPGAVVLSVEDDGPGIPEAERPLVLRRLYRLERSRTTPGHGLGLSLVAAVAALHDARLDLEDNAPGLRARLTFAPA